MLQDLKGRFRARLSHDSSSRPKSARILCKYYLSTLVYVATTLACIFMLVTLTTPLINCQKYPTTNCNQQQQQQNSQQHIHPYLHHQQQLQAASRQQRQFNLRNGPPVQVQPMQQKLPNNNQNQQLAQLQLQQQQQLGEQVAKQATQPNEVEHEEFSLALGLSSNQQQANGNYTLLPAPSAQDKASPQTPQVSNNQSEAANSKDSPQQAPQEIVSQILNTTPALPSDSIGSPVALQPPLTTTSSIQSTSSLSIASDSKVPNLSSSANPIVPVTTASSTISTTTSTVSSALTLDSQNQTTSLPATISVLEEINNNNRNIAAKQQLSQPMQQQHSTRQAHQHVGHGDLVETATALARAISQDNLEPTRAVNPDSYQARHGGSSSDFMFTNQANSQAQFQIGQNSRHSLMDSLPQAVSSSPSSISIITPLIGPPNQHQHQQQAIGPTSSVSASIGGPSLESQQSAMMKPLFVVGNPITERDYNGNSLYYHQYQQQAKHDQSYGNQVQQATHHESINKLPSKSEVGEHSQQQAADAPPSVPVPAPALAPVPNHSLTNPSHKIPQKTPTTEASAAIPSNQNNNQQQQQPAAQASSDKQARIDKSAESSDMLSAGVGGNDIMSTINTTSSYSGIDRMSGPPLMYSDGQLNSVLPQSQLVEQQAVSGSNSIGLSASQQMQHNNNNNTQFSLQPPSPRLFQGPSVSGAAVLGNNPRRPSLPPPVNQANAASGFRSPMSPSGPLVGTATPQTLQQAATPQTNSLQQPANSLMGNTAPFYQNSPPYAGATNMMSPIGAVNSIYNNNNAPSQPLTLGYNKNNFQQASSPQTSLAAPTQLQQQQQTPPSQQQQQQQQQLQLPSSQQLTLPQSSVIPTPVPGSATGPGRRPLNITRVERK